MRTIRYILLAVALALGALPASAQTIISRTTVSAAVSATAQSIVVASATGFTVGNFAWLDMEAVQITSVSGTTIGIQRGQIGTAARAHASGRAILTGNIQHFQQTDPTTLNGTCSRGVGEAAYSPWINVRTGVISLCGQSSAGGTTWTQTVTAPLTLNSIPTSF
jgi:hypothetical protein